MKQLTIKKNGVITHGPSQFSSDEELQAHLARHEEMGSYGKATHTVQVLISPEIPAVLDGDEVIVEATPAVYEEQNVPADYEVIIEDYTDTSARDEANAHAKRFLADTDWYILRELDSGVPCPAEIKEARQAARDLIK